MTRYCTGSVVQQSLQPGIATDSEAFSNLEETVQKTAVIHVPYVCRPIKVRRPQWGPTRLCGAEMEPFGARRRGGQARLDGFLLEAILYALLL